VIVKFHFDQESIFKENEYSVERKSFHVFKQKLIKFKLQFYKMRSIEEKTDCRYKYSGAKQRLLFFVFLHFCDAKATKNIMGDWLGQQ
jgi:hypothetical protein